MSIKQIVKRMAESVLGIRIYRNDLPRGTDLFFDLQKNFGLPGFQTVFDVGANTGQSALLYQQSFPRATIYSFEPVAATYALLQKTVENQARIRTFQRGMGKEPGQISINVSPDDSRISSITHGRPTDQLETITIDTVTDFCRAHNIPQIDFLKIDTEGYDLEVLTGTIPMLQEQKVRVIYAESGPMTSRDHFSDFFVSFDSYCNFFKAYNYELFGVYEQTPYWVGKRSIHFHNLVFICPALVG